MIHPMWNEYAKVALWGLCERGYQIDGVDAIPVDAVASCAARIADLLCAEYDKRCGASGAKEEPCTKA